ncbi:MAG: type I restriction enzyme HsdR N-terminal domain-containing protein [Eubacteriales bacterium]|nr:type I restriction enzyme HsdR N-terminal domain-containing protein [Eubacteriales bacterium]
MIIDISSIPLPPVYKRNNVECYLDPYRQKLIKITPEETIRQQVATFLESGLSVPHDMILLEQHMSHYGIKGKDRADIIVLRLNEETQELNPIAVVECKAPSVAIVDATVNQALRYGDALGCDFLFATNGTDIRAYKYYEAENEYRQLDALPSYNDMLDGKASYSKAEEVPPRTPFKKLSDTEIIKEYEYDGFIGKDTDKRLKPYILNLFEELLDVTKKFEPKNLKHFKIIEDYGIRVLSYGNASGGIFSGPYRSFLVETDGGNTEFVGLTVSSMQRTESPDGKIKTALCVSIDSFEKSHHSLQLNFDNSVHLQNEQMIFTHSGRITVGNKGSSKTADFIDYIRARYPELIRQNEVYLGTLDCTKLLYADQPDYSSFIENLILYALIRDEYRQLK